MSIPKNTKTGWLTKKSAGAVTRWQRRWVTLGGMILKYYKTPTQSKPQGVVPLPSYRVTLSDERPFCFVVEHLGSRGYLFAAENEEDREAWISALIAEGAEGPGGVTAADKQAQLAAQSKKPPAVEKPKSTVRKGWLVRQGAVMGQWRKRYCVLANQSLSVFEDDDSISGNPLEKCLLPNYTVNVFSMRGGRGTHHGFKLTQDACREFIFVTDGEPDRVEWINALLSTGVVTDGSAPPSSKPPKEAGDDEDEDDEVDVSEGPKPQPVLKLEPGEKAVEEATVPSIQVDAAPARRRRPAPQAKVVMRRSCVMGAPIVIVPRQENDEPAKKSRPAGAIAIMPGLGAPMRTNKRKSIQRLRKHISMAPADRDRMTLEWMNAHLAPRDIKVESDPLAALGDGVVIVHLVEQLAGRPVGRWTKQPRMQAQRIDNVSMALVLAEKALGIPTGRFAPHDFVNADDRHKAASFLPLLVAKYPAPESDKPVESVPDKPAKPVESVPPRKPAPGPPTKPAPVPVTEPVKGPPVKPHESKIKPWHGLAEHEVSSKQPELNDRVRVPLGDGIVKFAGTTSFAPGMWIGVALDGPTGKNDGEVKGKRYFTCKDKHGSFVKPDKVVVLQVAKQPRSVSHVPPSVPKHIVSQMKAPRTISAPTQPLPPPPSLKSEPVNVVAMLAQSSKAAEDVAKAEEVDQAAHAERVAKLHEETMWAGATDDAEAMLAAVGSDVAPAAPPVVQQQSFVPLGNEGDLADALADLEGALMGMDTRLGDADEPKTTAAAADDDLDEMSAMLKELDAMTDEVEEDMIRAQAPVCESCALPILPPDVPVLASGKAWHASHIICSECGQPCGEEGEMVEVEGRILCQNDYRTLFAPKCSICSESLVDGAMEDRQGNKYCQKHYDDRVCATCQGRVVGRSFKAMGLRYHPSCLFCTKCKRLLESGRYTPSEQGPLCRECA